MIKWVEVIARGNCTNGTSRIVLTIDPLQVPGF